MIKRIQSTVWRDPLTFWNWSHCLQTTFGVTTCTDAGVENPIFAETFKYLEQFSPLGSDTIYTLCTSYPFYVSDHTISIRQRATNMLCEFDTSFPVHFFLADFKKTIIKTSIVAVDYAACYQRLVERRLSSDCIQVSIFCELFGSSEFCSKISKFFGVCSVFNFHVISSKHIVEWKVTFIYLINKTTTYIFLLSRFSRRVSNKSFSFHNIFRFVFD